MQTKLYNERFVCAARKDHPIFDMDIGLEEFLSFPHVMTSSGDRTRGVVDVALDRINRRRRLMHTVSSFSSAPYLVEHSDCLLTAPERFLRFCSRFHEIEIFDNPLELKPFDVKLFCFSVFVRQ